PRVGVPLKLGIGAGSSSEVFIGPLRVPPRERSGGTATLSLPVTRQVCRTRVLRQTAGFQNGRLPAFLTGRIDTDKGSKKISPSEFLKRHFQVLIAPRLADYPSETSVGIIAKRRKGSRQI